MKLDRFKGVRSFVQQRIREHRESNSVIEQEWNDGRWFAIYHRPTSDGGTVSIRMDITERKQAEAALQESEAKYRDLVETSLDLIWRLDEEARFTYLNPAWQETLGYDLEEMLGRPITDFKKPEEIARSYDVFKEILAGGDVHNYETTYISKSGQELTLTFKGKPIYDSSGTIVGTRGTAQDITERKRVEQELTVSRSHLMSIFDNSPNVIILKDLEGRYLIVNRRFEEWFGFSSDEVIGKTALNFFPKDVVDKSEALDQEAIKTKQVISQELEIPVADGSVISIYHTKFPVLDDNGQVVEVGTITEDITE